MNISVIITIFNSEKYLERSIRSVIQQLEEDDELILVNDGSSDGSKEICDLYKHCYNNVVVVHKENGGVSTARNEGMKNAHRDYIVFVDADDYIEKGFIRTIKEVCVNKPDIALFDYIEDDQSPCKEERKIIEYSDKDINQMIICNFEAKELTNGSKINMRTVWGKAFKKTFLEKNHIYFDENVKIGEDMIFMLKVYEALKRAIYITYTSYHYFFSHEESITNQYKPQLKQLLLEYEKSIEPWIRRNKIYMKYYANYRLNDIILYLKFVFFNSKNTKKWKQIKKEMREVFLEQDYKQFYNISKKSKLIKKYGLLRRYVFWLAIHGRFTELKIITKIKYS